MDDTSDRAITSIAAAQHGVFTASQADDVGFEDYQREYRVRAGRWELVHPGVYRIGGAPKSWRASLLASCWAVRAPSRRTARRRALWGGRGGAPATGRGPAPRGGR